ncbi:MAG: hypothetical protein BGO78_13245 [Chloroflexi bacterium 44-23]|nr:MAG: hypothetical protein BGO78_13245 [Chloroflexi bacterium 44-23]
MAIIRRFFSLVLIFLFIAGISVGAQAQNQPQQFIGDPGFWVKGAILQYYLQSPNPELLFGDPISVQFLDPTSNLYVQYFEKAQLQLTGDQPDSQVVSAPLGEMLYEPGRNLDAKISYDPSICNRFENSFITCYAFWHFYQVNNGSFYLGLPLANTEVNAAGFLVQYFQNGILEWHPEKEAGQRVILADLGSQYFAQFNGNSAYKQPDLSSLPATILRSPQVSVFVANAIVTANSSQTVHVVVIDQYQQPMTGAVVGVTATMPDGRDSFFRLPETDAFGLSTFELLVGDLEPRDVVLLNALVTTPYGSSTGESWFRIWW